MRNLKKFLALVLAMMMVMSLMVTVNAASISDYKDADKITPVYAEAIEVLSALKVLEGDASGFRPGDTITRAEAAKILYCIHTGDTAKNSKIPEFYRDNCEFTDVLGTADDWAAGYIGYAAANGLVLGDGNGKFRPSDPVTGYEMQTMLLRAVGYGKRGEFVGDGYKTESTKLATAQGILTNIPAGVLGLKATREMAAEMTFQTIANVPQVTYNELLNSYNTTNGNGWLPGTAVNSTLGWDNFRLKNIVGEITAVDRDKGSATVVSYAPGTSWGDLNDEDNEIYSVLNTNLTWEDIGYAVDIWGRATNLVDKNEYEAIIPEVLQGDSTVVTYKVDDLADLWTRGSTDKVVTLAKIYHVYYNGELLPMYPTYKADGTVNKSKPDALASGKTMYYYDSVDECVYYVVGSGSSNGYHKVAPVNGLKVDLIDTDLAGEVESIVVTEYTVAEVAAITDGNNKGANGYLDNSYYFDAYNQNPTAGADNGKKVYDGSSIKISVNNDKPNVVRFDDTDVIVKDNAKIDVGDVVTYVVYDGYVYTTVAPATTAVFSKVVYDRQNDGYIYTIGGETYERANPDYTANKYAQQYWRGKDTLLAGNKTGTTVVVYTDPYGYMLKAEEPTAKGNYLFVLAADHISSVDQSARVKVILDDGTVDTSYVRLIKSDTYDGFTDRLQGHMYLYSKDPVTGWYNLYESNAITRDCIDFTGNLTGTKVDVSAEGQTGILTDETVVWDVRDMLAGKADEPTKIVGYRALGAITGAELHYVTNKNHYVTLAYLTDDANTVAVSGSKFVVYTTIGSFATRESTATTDYYWLNVIDFAKGTMGDVLLTAAQYRDIQTYGQGVYTYTVKNGALVLTYESFEQGAKYDITWQVGALTYENVAGQQNKIPVSYNSSSVIFYSITAENAGPAPNPDYKPGTATPYAPVSGTDDVAYLVFNSDKSAVTAIYVLDGGFATKTTGNATPESKRTSTSEKDNIYYTEAGKFTSYEKLTPYTVTVYDSYYGMEIGFATYNTRNRGDDIEIDLGDWVSVGLADNSGKSPSTTGIQYQNGTTWADASSTWVNRFKTKVGSTLVLHIPATSAEGPLRNLKVWVDLSNPASDDDIDEEVTDNGTGGLTPGDDLTSESIGGLDVIYSELGIEVGLDKDGTNHKADKHLFHIAIDSAKFNAAAKAAPDQIKKLVARGEPYGDLVVGIQFNTGFFGTESGDGSGSSKDALKDIMKLYFAKSDAAHNHDTETPYKPWLYSEAKDGVYGNFDQDDLNHLKDHGFLIVFFKIGTLSQDGTVTLKTSKSTVGSVHYTKADEMDLWFNVDMLTGADATPYLTAE